MILDRQDKLHVLLAKLGVVVPEPRLVHGCLELPGISVYAEALEAVRESLATARLRAEREPSRTVNRQAPNRLSDLLSTDVQKYCWQLRPTYTTHKFDQQVSWFVL